MKIIDLLTAQPVLDKLINKFMPAKVAYALAKNIRLINQELDDYNKTRIKLLEDNWSFNPETNRYDVPDEDTPKWKKMHEELLDSEVNYQPYIINISLLESIEMTPADFTSLWFIFEE